MTEDNDRVDFGVSVMKDGSILVAFAHGNEDAPALEILFPNMREFGCFLVAIAKAAVASDKYLKEHGVTQLFLNGPNLSLTDMHANDILKQLPKELFDDTKD